MCSSGSYCLFNSRDAAMDANHNPCETFDVVPHDAVLLGISQQLDSAIDPCDFETFMANIVAPADLDAGFAVPDQCPPKLSAPVMPPDNFPAEYPQDSPVPDYQRRRPPSPEAYSTTSSFSSDALSPARYAQKIHNVYAQAYNYVLSQSLPVLEDSTPNPRGSLSSNASSNTSSSYVQAASRNKNTKKGPKKKYCCGICRKEFLKPSSLKTHMNIHTGAKPFMCPYDNCSTSFNAKSNMLRHYKSHFKQSTKQSRGK